MPPSVLSPGLSVSQFRPSDTAAAQRQRPSVGAVGPAHIVRSNSPSSDVEQSNRASMPDLLAAGLGRDHETESLSQVRHPNSSSSKNPGISSAYWGTHGTVQADLIQSQPRTTTANATTGSSFASDELWKAWLADQDTVASYVLKGPITDGGIPAEPEHQDEAGNSSEASQPGQNAIECSETIKLETQAESTPIEATKAAATHGTAVTVPSPPDASETAEQAQPAQPPLQPITMAKPFTVRQTDQEPVSETPRKQIQSRSPPRMLQATPVRLQEEPPAGPTRWEEAGDRDKMGFLMKETQPGCFGTRWVTRLFVLKDHSLAYFRETSNTVPRNRCDVTASRCTKIGEYKGRRNVFRLHLPTRDVVLSAYTLDEMAAWVDALTRASGATVINGERTDKAAPAPAPPPAPPAPAVQAAAVRVDHLRPLPAPAASPPAYAGAKMATFTELISQPQALVQAQPQAPVQAQAPAQPGLPPHKAHSGAAPHLHQIMPPQYPDTRPAAAAVTSSPARRVPGPVVPSPNTYLAPKPRQPAETQGVAEPQIETPTRQLQAQVHKPFPTSPTGSQPLPASPPGSQGQLSSSERGVARRLERAWPPPRSLESVSSPWKAEEGEHRAALGAEEAAPDAAEQGEWTWERALEWFEQEKVRDRQALDARARLSGDGLEAPEPVPVRERGRSTAGFVQPSRALRRDLDSALNASGSSPVDSYSQQPPARQSHSPLPPLPPPASGGMPSQSSPRPHDPCASQPRSVSPPPERAQAAAQWGHSRPPLDPGRTTGLSRSASPPNRVPSSENFEIEFFGSDYRRGSGGSDQLWARASGRTSPANSNASHRLPSKMDAFRDRTYDGQPRPPRSPVKNVPDRGRVFADPTSAYIPNASLNGSAAPSPLTTPRLHPMDAVRNAHQVEQVSDWMGVRSPSPAVPAPWPSASSPDKGSSSVPVPLPSASGGVPAPAQGRSPPSPRPLLGGPGAPLPSPPLSWVSSQGRAPPLPAQRGGAVDLRQGWTTFQSARKFGQQGPGAQLSYELPPN